jgi:hypothetical protein
VYGFLELKNIDFMSIFWQICDQSLSGKQYLRENWWMEVFFTE